MIDILQLIAAAISFNVCVKVFIMVCIMTITRCMIEGIMAITIEMMFHHTGHVIEMIKSVRNAPSSSPLCALCNASADTAGISSRAQSSRMLLRLWRPPSL